jgi:hypothetical protein
MNDGTEMAPERIDIGAPVAEELPSLTDFAEEVGGAWPNGWYSATVIEGYSTSKGTQFTTSDDVSKAGDSRNFRICVSMDGGKLGTRNTFTSINYRTTDFSADRLTAVKEAREQFKGTRGAWIGQTDLQRTSLALAQLGQLEGALGFRLKLHPAGYILASSLVGQKMDVRLTMGDKGYNEINAFDKAGTRTKK